MSNVVPFPPSNHDGLLADGSAEDIAGLQVYLHTVMTLGDSIADCIEVIARCVTRIDPGADTLLSLLNELRTDTAAVTRKLRDVDATIALWSNDVVFADGPP